MTFDEWARTINPLHQETDDAIETRLWRSCWETAIKEEREACAKICQGEGWIAAEMGHERFARYAAEMARNIMERSNVKCAS